MDVQQYGKRMRALLVIIAFLIPTLAFASNWQVIHKATADWTAYLPGETTDVARPLDRVGADLVLRVELDVPGATLAYVSPMTFEKNWLAAQQGAAAWIRETGAR
jgi:hypothetical protein